MAWIEQVNHKGMSFHVGALGGWADHGFSLILSKDELDAIGERLPEVVNWFEGEGQEWCLVRDWRGCDYDRNYFSSDQLWMIHNSQFADDYDKWRCYNDPPREKQAPPEKKRHPGYVYLIRADNGFYKIGRTVNAQKRIETLEVRLPFPIETLHIASCEDMAKTEKELHAKFQDKRKDGEWFALTDEDVEFIKSL